MVGAELAKKVAYESLSIAIIGFLFLSAFAVAVDKARVPTNSWECDGLKFHAGKSVWTNTNQIQIDFIELDRMSRPSPFHIGVTFKKLPSVSGDYRIVRSSDRDDEVGISAADLHNVYFSNTGHAAVAHVTLKDGKHWFWANGVMMLVVPQHDKGSTHDYGDSTVCTFNLMEF